MKTIHKSKHNTKIFDVFWHKKAPLFMSLAFLHNSQTAWSEELLFQQHNKIERTRSLIIKKFLKTKIYKKTFYVIRLNTYNKS